VTLNYGLIIFLLTLIIKLVLFPLTYKSYMSQTLLAQFDGSGEEVEEGDQYRHLQKHR